ncbi:unnamed protein product [Pedinophyceae sp. YPF-701]|nr:unnamed protein product [Pedinophyceae sp. YPF-701]
MADDFERLLQSVVAEEAAQANGATTSQGVYLDPNAQQNAWFSAPGVGAQQQQMPVADGSSGGAPPHTDGNTRGSAGTAATRGRGRGRGRARSRSRGKAADAGDSSASSGDEAGGKGSRKRTERARIANREAQARYQRRRKEKFAELEGAVQELTGRLKQLEALESEMERVQGERRELEMLVRVKEARVDRLKMEKNIEHAMWLGRMPQSLQQVMEQLHLDLLRVPGGLQAAMRVVAEAAPGAESAALATHPEEGNTPGSLSEEPDLPWVAGGKGDGGYGHGARVAAASSGGAGPSTDGSVPAHAEAGSPSALPVWTQLGLAPPDPMFFGAYETPETGPIPASLAARFKRLVALQKFEFEAFWARERLDGATAPGDTLPPALLEEIERRMKGIVLVAMMTTKTSVVPRVVAREHLLDLREVFPEEYSRQSPRSAWRDVIQTINLSGCQVKAVRLGLEAYRERKGRLAKARQDKSMQLIRTLVAPPPGGAGDAFVDKEKWSGELQLLLKSLQALDLEGLQPLSDLALLIYTEVLKPFQAALVVHMASPQFHDVVGFASAIVAVRGHTECDPLAPS